jgi:hypothetical protein
MRILYIVAAVLVCAGLAFSFWFLYMPTPAVAPAPSSPVYTNASADLITATLPFPGAVTGKTFSVIGQARGMWFFEASFPIEVIDKNGVVLATAVAQAQGEWMTENFVPFKAEVSVPESYIGPATLVLKKDNPSGLPEHDASMSFPITIEY